MTMKAVCWYGYKDMRVENVPEPTITNPRDAILKVTSTALCGSDLHLYHAQIPAMRPGDIMGHEFMGEIVALGKDVTNLTVGDRVVIPFTIACGRCWFCDQKLWSLCDNSNPNANLLEPLYGQSASALFGYSHLYGGFAGGQAEYVRVPFADVGAFRIPEELTDEQVLFLTDIYPTGFMAAENCNIKSGDTVAIWGAGPVGQFAIQSAWLLGAERVIVVDCEPERLKLAAEWGKAETLNTLNSDPVEAIIDMTGGRGPDSCIDAVGMEAHGEGLVGWYDRITQGVKIQSDRPTALREAIVACRKGGTVSIPGVYGGIVDKFPLGAAFGKGLTFKMGQTHVHNYLQPLLETIQDGRVDPTRVITHRMKLDQAPEAYNDFDKKNDGSIKYVFTP